MSGSWARTPATRADAVAGVAYPAVLRRPDRPRWTGAFGMFAGVALYVVALSLVAQGVVALGWALAGRPGAFAGYYAAAMRFENPVGMLATNLAIGCLIVISAAIVAFLHRMRPVWLTSVMPGVRWRYLVVCAVIAFVVFTAVQALSMTMSGLTLAWRPQPHAGWFVLVVVTTTWVQAAAEEVFFRGYVMQALGSLGQPGGGGVDRLLTNDWFPVIVSALLFACFHGIDQQNPALFFDRLGFGLVAGVLVWRTGGLEAGIAAHVVNNLMAWLLAAATSSVAAVRAISTLDWASALLDVGGFTLFAVIAWWLGRRMSVHTLTPAPASPGRGRVGR